MKKWFPSMKRWLVLLTVFAYISQLQNPSFDGGKLYLSVIYTVIGTASELPNGRFANRQLAVDITSVSTPASLQSTIATAIRSNETSNGVTVGAGNLFFPSYSGI